MNTRILIKRLAYFHDTISTDKPYQHMRYGLPVL